MLDPAACILKIILSSVLVGERHSQVGGHHLLINLDLAACMHVSPGCEPSAGRPIAQREGCPGVSSERAIDTMEHDG